MDPKEVLSVVEGALNRVGREDVIPDVRRLIDDGQRLLAAVTLDPMSIFDPATKRILDVNKAWVELYGFTREEAVAGLKVTDVSAEPDRTTAAIAHAPSAAGSRADIRWHRSKSGVVFPVELTCGKIVIEGREAMYAVMRDVTQHDSARRTLARSEASFRALIENMPDGIVVHRHGSLVYMNAAFREMLGYPRDENIQGLRVI